MTTMLRKNGWRLASFLVAQAAAGQVLLTTTGADQTWRFAGNQFNYSLPIDPYRDINNDGVVDVLVSSPTVIVDGLCEFGTVWLVSSVDGATIDTATQPCNWFLGQEVASLDDLDGDGAPDYAIGAPETDRVDVVLSSSPVRIHSTLEGEESGIGREILNLGDINDDGVGDYAVSANYYKDAGAVYLLSGASGAIIRRLDGDLETDAFSAGIANVGDLNSDGVPDLAVGAPCWLQSRPGYVRLFSGADGATLGTIRPGPAGVGDHFGGSVAALGDINGDGACDLAVGAYLSSADSGGQGRVYLVSPVDGAIIRTHDADASDLQFGRAVGNVGDIDGDGFADYAIRRRIGTPHLPQVLVHSGRTGAILRRIDPGSDLQAGALAWSAGDMVHADVDADGDDDMLIVSLATADLPGLIRGAVYVFVTPPRCAADVMVNGAVDFGDLNLVLSGFNAAGFGLQADVNLDGFVNFGDLNLVLGAWGGCPE